MSEARAERSIERPISLWLLCLTLAILSFGGLVGAWMFFSHPDGKGIGMVATLASLPVASFVLPGVFLLTVMCVLPALLIFGLLARPGWAWMERMSDSSGMHWSWVASLALCVVIAGWLGLQTVYIGFEAPAQYFTAVLGAGILTFSLVPSTRRALRK